MPLLLLTEIIHACTNGRCVPINTDVHVLSLTHTHTLVHKGTNMSHTSSSCSVPWHTHTNTHTHTFAHTQAEALNRDIQDHAIITRQMNTWRQSSLRRGAEQCGATEVMISRTKRQTWESRFRSQPPGHITPQAWPWRTFWNTRDSLWLSPVQIYSSAVGCLLVRMNCMCARLCESVSRSKADVSSGEENPKNWLLYHWGYLPILGINIFNSPS